MRKRTNIYMQYKAKRKKVRRTVFSIFSYIGAGFFTIGGLGMEPIDILPFSFALILAGVGLILQQGAKNAAVDERRFAQLDPYAYFEAYMVNHENVPNGDYRSIADERPKSEPPKPVLEEYFDQNLSIMEEGRAFAKEIDKANDLIPDDKISEDLFVICRHVNDIFEAASKDRAAERQIRKFSNIYLPKTLKLCNLYIDLDKKRAQTKTVTDLKNQIAVSIANARCAFENFNENLMGQACIDIESEIKSFEDILTIDGLLGRRELVLPDKQKEKEKV